MIYFTQDTQTKAIKIGYSKNPNKRRSGLQSATPGQLILLGCIHGGLEHERGYHDKFAQHRLHGEWFKGDILHAVLEVIANNPIDRPPPSNVIVIGETDFCDEALVSRALAELHAKNPIAWVITGGDRHLEHWAWAWAHLNRVEVYRYYPKWTKYSKFAAFKVGPQMLRSMFDPKTLLAFLTDKAKSNTLTLIARAQKMGIEVVIKGRQTVVQA
jgi:hypothetical protein